MKFGVKTFCDEKFADYFKDKADFLEIMAIPEENYSFLENYPLPIVIHAVHKEFGVNVADSSLFEKNLMSIKFAISLADRFGAKKIILHPGFLENETCSVGQSIKFFSELDERVIFENMAFTKDYVCSSLSGVESFISKTRRDLCFDVNHAIQNAMKSDEDFMERIKDFLKFNPKHYHLGGQNGFEDKNTHLSFDESTIPLKEILGLFPDNAEVTLEVSRDFLKTEKDLKLVRSLIA